MSMTYEPIEFEEPPELPRQQHPGRTLTRLPSRHDSVQSQPPITTVPNEIPAKCSTTATTAHIPKLPRSTVTIVEMRKEVITCIETSITLQEAGTKYLEFLTEVNPNMEQMIENMAVDAIRTANLNPQYERLREAFARAVQSWVQKKKCPNPAVLDAYQTACATTLQLKL